MVYTYNGIISSLNKEGKPNICSDMDETGGHKTKWNKSDTGQILLDIPCVMNLKESIC